jgi:hypothetical protein
VTLTELKLLKRGDRVLLGAASGDTLPPIRGTVNSVDPLSVEVFWEDGTSSLIWVRHVERELDMRHMHMTRDTSPKAVPLAQAPARIRR